MEKDLQEQIEFPSQTQSLTLPLQNRDSCGQKFIQQQSYVSINLLLFLPTAAMQFFLLRSSRFCTAYADSCMQPCRGCSIGL